MKNKATFQKKKVANKWYNFRSKMEWHYALYLEDIKQKGIIRDWEYEPTLFKFDVKRTNKVKAYLPDFKIFLKNGDIEYHETKGILSKRNTVAFYLMKAQYPKIKLKIIYYNSSLYKSIRNKYALNERAKQHNIAFWICFFLLALYILS